ncbi:MAG: heavy-metal-associated domain-containing protein [Candidatus Galacturonibacter soehngenii]|nr:heavy-metal-associated domain-containing protein [Candidatus Galacturonibacter soehngenii]
MQNIRLNVDGLEDIETQDKVKKQIEGIVGVGKVSVSAGQDYVDIQFDEQTSSSEISSHLQNNGYKVTDMLDKRFPL